MFDGVIRCKSVIQYCIGVVDYNRTDAHEACEERLFHVRVALKCEVLDDRRQLVVIADEDPTLEARLAAGGGVRVLQQQRDERLDLQDLRRFLHY